MKTVAVSLLLATAVLAAGAAQRRVPARKPDRAPVAHGNYVRLDEWSRANEFQIRWLKRDETLQLSNRLARLVFIVDPRQDSCRAEINGVEVRLLVPLVYQNGAPFISQLDLDKTLRPVLLPPANARGIKIKTICLDPGHGGKDPGFIVGAHREKQYTLLLAQDLRDQLAKAGFKVRLTRTTDAFIPLPARPALARRSGADLFVSLHFNSTQAGRDEVKGTEVYCLTPVGAPSTNAQGEGAGAGWFAGNRHDEKNMLLAYQVQKSFAKSLQIEDRGVRRARYAVLRDATMPAILIEGGFMSHPVEGKKIFDPAYRRQMAQAIVSGITAYKKIVER